MVNSFVHPDEIFSESYEKGFNGKDFWNVEISSKSGLSRKIGPERKPKVFFADIQNVKYAKYYR